MNNFTASNGIIVAFVGSSQRWTVDPMADGGDYANVTKAQMQALREFFQAEADERLSRWRWPENPDYVAIPRERTDTPREKRRVRVIHEPSGDFMDTVEGSSLVGVFKDAARAFFDAHPEPKPLPDVDGIYAVSPQVHPYERLIQRRNGEWLHLRRHVNEFETDTVAAEVIAQSAVNEGRLTRLVPEVSS